MILAQIQEIAVCWHGLTNQSRILVTIDTDFGQLIFVERLAHSGLIRLPDVPSLERHRILEDLLNRFSQDIKNGSVVTVRGGRVRISKVKDFG